MGTGTSGVGARPTVGTPYPQYMMPMMMPGMMDPRFVNRTPAAEIQIRDHAEYVLHEQEKGQLYGGITGAAAGAAIGVKLGLLTGNPLLIAAGAVAGTVVGGLVGAIGGREWWANSAREEDFNDDRVYNGSPGGHAYGVDTRM